MKTQNSNSKPSKRVVQHTFRGIREVIVTNAALNTPAPVLTGSDGNATMAYTLNPLGMVAVSQSSTSNTDKSPVDLGHLKWLFFQANGFMRYRVTRAKLIFVSNVGSTTTGSVLLFGSGDASDVITGITSASLSGASRQFDLAAGASGKEMSIQIPVDSSWKKVTQNLSVTGGNLPFYGTSNVIVPINTVNDICFGAFSVRVQGAPASTTLGNMFLDYDIEFRDPVSPNVNF